MKFEQSLAHTGSKELQIPHPLARKLFAFAEQQGISEGSFDDYGNEAGKENSRAVELPEEFQAFTEGRPGPFYIVAHENRRSNYYQEGTRSRMVRLSTVRTRAETDNRVTEIDVEETDPATGGKLKLTVKESINNKQFTRINTAPEGQTNQPHGSAEYAYEVRPDGSRRRIHARFQRLDEGMFALEGTETPIRWLRNLTVTETDEGKPTATYRDQYLMGRPETNQPMETVSITTTLEGLLQAPDSAKIEIGFGPESASRIIAEDPQQHLTVVEHAPVGRLEDRPRAMLKEDPNYAPLFSETPDSKTFLQAMNGKIQQLETQWDQPQAVFSKSLQAPETPDALNQGKTP